MKTTYLILFLFSILTYRVQAKELQLVHERGTISIPQKSGWELSKDIFGMPFMYFSPKASGQRSNISFAHTGSDFSFDKKAMKKNEDQYKEGKQKWAKKTGADLIKVDSYKSHKNKKGHLVHEIGAEYRFKEKLYKENSYYIECKEKMIFSKSLSLKKQADHQKVFKEIIEDLNCD